MYALDLKVIVTWENITPNGDHISWEPCANNEVNTKILYGYGNESVQKNQSISCEHTFYDVTENVEISAGTTGVYMPKTISKTQSGNLITATIYMRGSINVDEEEGGWSKFPTPRASYSIKVLTCQDPNNDNMPIAEVRETTRFVHSNVSSSSAINGGWIDFSEMWDYSMGADLKLFGLNFVEYNGIKAKVIATVNSPSGNIVHSQDVSPSTFNDKSIRVPITTLIRQWWSQSQNFEYAGALFYVKLDDPSDIKGTNGIMSYHNGTSYVQSIDWAQCESYFEERDVEVEIKWFEKNTKTGERTELQCGDFNSNVSTFGNDKESKKQDSCAGFTDKIMGKFDAKQNSMTKGFKEVSKWPGRPTDYTTYIVFENEREVTPEEDFEIVVEWYEKNTKTGNRTKLECGDFVSGVSVTDGSNNQPAKDTCAGFTTKVTSEEPDATQYIKTPDFVEFEKNKTSNKITFKNEREVTPEEDFEIVVEWYEKNTKTGDRTKLECGNFVSAVTVIDGSKNQPAKDTCAGFTTKVTSEDPDATQNIKTPNFVEFEKEKTPKKITFKNEREVTPEEDFEIVVEWYEEDRETNELTQLQCQGLNYKTMVTINSEDGTKRDNTCSGFTVEVRGGEVTTTQEIDITSKEFTEFEKIEEPRKVTFKNKRVIDKLEVIVEWYEENSKTGELTQLECNSRFESRVVTYVNNATSKVEFTSCGLTDQMAEGSSYDAEQTVITPDFKEFEKIKEDKKITFKNKKLVIIEEDFEIIVEWYDKNTKTGDRTKLECGSYSSAVSVIDGANSQDPQNTCAGFTTKVTSDEPDATQNIQTEGFSEFEKVKEPGKITFKNEREFNPEEDFEIVVEWYNENSKTKELTRLDCGDFISAVSVIDGSDNQPAKDTCAGFTTKVTDPEPDATQNIKTPEFEEFDKTKEPSRITFKNKREFNPEEDFEVVVEWYEKDPKTNAKTKLDCGDFVSAVIIIDGSENQPAKDTCAGFTVKVTDENPDATQEIKTESFSEFDKITEPGKITFKNEREKESTEDEFEIIVEWYEKDPKTNSRTKLECGNFETAVSVIDGANSQDPKDTCSGFTTKVTDDEPDATQNIKTPEFSEFEKDKTPNRITFKNEREKEPENSDVEIAVRWFIRESSSSPRIEQFCGSMNSSISLKDESTSYQEGTCEGFRKTVTGDFDAQQTSISDDYVQVDKIKTSNKITFENEKIVPPPPPVKDLIVEVEWYIKKGKNPPELQTCTQYNTSVDVTDSGEPYSNKSTSCGFTEYDLVEPDAEQTGSLPEDFVQIDKTYISGSTDKIIFKNQKEIPSKDLEVRIRWFEQKNKFRPAKEKECSDFNSRVTATDEGSFAGSANVGCSHIFEDLIEPDASQVPTGDFTEFAKSTLIDTPTYMVIEFKNIRCYPGQAVINGECEVEPMPPYIGIPGIVNPTYPEGPNTLEPITPSKPEIPGGGVDPNNPGGGTYPGKPGKPETGNPDPYNPIFIPPTVDVEVPTQVSKKPFRPKFVEPNIKVTKVPEPDDWEYEIEYCDPYPNGKCYGEGYEEPPLPIDDEEDFQKWINGKFYVYLIDAMINPDYIDKCQTQNSDKTGDLTLNSTIPFYFSGADMALNSGKSLKNHAPYKSYGIKFSLGAGNGNNPQSLMDGVSIPDAHQKLTFMVEFVPNSANSQVVQHNICNIDHFALRPAYFVAKTSGDFNNFVVGNKAYFNNKPRVTSSFSSNLDIHSRLFYPSDYKGDDGKDPAYGVPNYQIGLGFYKENPSTGKPSINLNSSSIISTQQDLVQPSNNEPYIVGVSKTCQFKSTPICANRLCDESAPTGRALFSSAGKTVSQTTTSTHRRIRRAGDEQEVVAPKAPAQRRIPRTGEVSVVQNHSAATLKGSRAQMQRATQKNAGVKIWESSNMLIETIFGYFNDSLEPLSANAAHNEIIKSRRGLVYFTGSRPTSTFDEYKNRSLISTHSHNGNRIFTYNNIGDMQIVLIDNRWTIYDQYTFDAAGRVRGAKCDLNRDLTQNNRHINEIIGCSVAMEDESFATYVPDFIEITPLNVTDKLQKDGKEFTYFANKDNNKTLEDQMSATYELDATAYVSSEIYGTPTYNFGKDRPLIAFGYEGNNPNSDPSQTCGKDITFLLNFDFGCEVGSNFKDERVSENIAKRCFGNSFQESDCRLNPLDSRCHKVEKAKKPSTQTLKENFEIFNEFEKVANSYKVGIKDFVNGSATIKDIYFNFKRSKNYPTAPKIINVNDFDGNSIVQVGFNGSNKNFIPALHGNSQTEQTNRFDKMGTSEALGKNAHFYYGYVNSAAREYLLCEKGDVYSCDGKNRVDINVLIYGEIAYCLYDETKHLCADPLFLNVFNKDGRVEPRRMYKNSYDNYDNSQIDTFASKYRSKLKWQNEFLTPSSRENSTKSGVEIIEFEKFPSNFSEDLEEVYTSDYFVYSDGRGFIPNATPYNVFKLIYHPDQGNTWGGQGSTKNLYKDRIPNNGKEVNDWVGEVPMGKDLQGTSKSINRRIRY